MPNPGIAPRARLRMKEEIEGSEMEGFENGRKHIAVHDTFGGRREALFSLSTLKSSLYITILYHRFRTNQNIRGYYL